MESLTELCRRPFGYNIPLFTVVPPLVIYTVLRKSTVCITYIQSTRYMIRCWNTHNKQIRPHISCK